MEADSRLDVIHGDLKPANVLIFRHDEEGFVAKVADFGYSTLVVRPDRPIYVPKTAPWYAPEHHHRGFLLQDAKKLDFFSLGLLFLWLLFEPKIRVQTKDPEIESGSSAKFTVEMRMIQWLEHQPPGQDLITCVTQMLHEVSGILIQQRDDLIQFFNKTLAMDPADRALDIRGLLPLIGDQKLPYALSLHTTFPSLAMLTVELYEGIVSSYPPKTTRLKSTTML
jgi:serine/threonine protein kinase